MSTTFDFNKQNNCKFKNKSIKILEIRSYLLHQGFNRAAFYFLN